MALIGFAGYRGFGAGSPASNDIFCGDQAATIAALQSQGVNAYNAAAVSAWKAKNGFRTNQEVCAALFGGGGTSRTPQPTSPATATPPPASGTPPTTVQYGPHTAAMSRIIGSRLSGQRAMDVEQAANGSWWATQSTTTQYAIIGAGILVAGLLVYKFAM